MKIRKRKLYKVIIVQIDCANKQIEQNFKINNFEMHSIRR